MTRDDFDTSEMRKDVTWNDICHCGKRFGDHNNQDLHDCELTGDENQRGLSKTYSRKGSA